MWVLEIELGSSMRACLQLNGLLLSSLSDDTLRIHVELEPLLSPAQAEKLYFPTSPKPCLAAPLFNVTVGFGDVP